jgi:hypothetical protein
MSRPRHGGQGVCPLHGQLQQCPRCGEMYGEQRILSHYAACSKARPTEEERQASEIPPAPKMADAIATVRGRPPHGTPETTKAHWASRPLSEPSDKASWEMREPREEIPAAPSFAERIRQMRKAQR